MSGAVINMVGKRMVKKQLRSHFDSEALYFGEGRHKNWRGKVIREKFPIPADLSEEEAALLRKVKKLAYNLDMKFGTVLGTKMGWSAVFGLVPGIGDFADSGLGLLVLREIRKIQPPLSAQEQTTMLFRIAFQFVIGIVPFVGDWLDGAYKANSRNVAALERELVRRAAGRAKAGGVRLDHEKDYRRPGHRLDYYEHDVRPGGNSPPAYGHMDGAAQYPFSHDRRIEPQQAPRNGNARRRWFDQLGEDGGTEMAPALPPRTRPEMQQSGYHY